MNNSHDQALAFGPFVLHPKSKLLHQEGRPVALGSRAFEVLVVLTEKAGEVVGRGELMERVWPHSVVEENSLRVHISALRRALGESPTMRYIVNVPGRGYSFVGDVARVTLQRSSEPASWTAIDNAARLPVRRIAPIGRASVTAELAGQLAQQRLVTVVGPGGQGKTTVALAVAEREREHYRDGARFVDLGSVSDPAMLPYAVAAVLGVSLPSDQPLADLCRCLAEARMLLVLDNCEHVLQPIAVLVERLLATAPAVHLLLTSREALYIDGEWVYHLPALATPMGKLASPTDALNFAALQLFVERAESNSSHFALNAENMETVAHLCRQLDGIPLAIELAAARVDSLGVEGLAARIDDLFSLLTRGRRNALPRHGTLQALFDWSYALLNDAERLVLARLSVFRSRFSLEAATFVCGGDTISSVDIQDALAGLAAKSLIALGPSESHSGYYLLNTTRRYAASWLSRDSDARRVFALHARYMHQLLVKASDDLRSMTPQHWVKTYGGAPADLRASLDWCFRDDGDTLLGLELTVIAWFPAVELAMLNEYRARLRTALLHLARLARQSPELAARLDRIEIRILSALSLLAGQDSQHGGEYGVVRDRLLPLLQRLGTDGDVEAIHSMCIGAFGHGDYFWVRMFAMRIGEVALAPGPDPNKLKSIYTLLSNRWTSLTAHYMGEHGRARDLAAQVMEAKVDLRHVNLLGHVPHRVSMRILIARIDWIEGSPNRALAIAREAAHLSAEEHPFALCQALALAIIPIALWRGDIELAAAETERLFEWASRHALDYWTNWARGYQRVIVLNAGPCEIREMPEWQVSTNPMALDMLATFDTAMMAPGAISRVDQNAVAWNAPEVLRRRAIKLLPSEPQLGESMLQRALALARCQRALAWELRCAISLAQHWYHEGRARDGYQLVLCVFEKFDEGFDTWDLKHARAILARLATPAGQGGQAPQASPAPQAAQAGLSVPLSVATCA
jgi:predicted ATPase/DNA-binding winged helix-turn-helix (wHTH) protein